MQTQGGRTLDFPQMRSNPFDSRPLERGQLKLLVGRKDLLGTLIHYLRFPSPRVICLAGERGSGRTSLAQTLSSITEQYYSPPFWPSGDVATRFLEEMYCSLLDVFDVPPVRAALVERLVTELQSRTGYMPMITFDFPHVSGANLASAVSDLMPVLRRLRALVLVTVTPGQLSAFPEDLTQEMDVTDSLAPLERSEVKDLIQRRMTWSSRERWAPPEHVIDNLLDVTRGHAARVLRHLRDLVDHSRGVRMASMRRIELELSLEVREPTQIEDESFQRVASEAKPIVEPHIVIKDPDAQDTWDSQDEEEDDDFADDVPEVGYDEAADDDDGWEPDTSLPELSLEEEFADEEPEEESEPLPEPEEFTPLPDEEDFSSPDDGAEMLEMAPGTAPPPAVRGFGGLLSRNKEANIGQQLDDSPIAPVEIAGEPLNPKPVPEPEIPPEAYEEEEEGPHQARLSEDGPTTDLEREPDVMTPEAALWMDAGSEPPVPEIAFEGDSRPPEPEPTVMREALHAMRPPEPAVAAAPALDVDFLSTLGDSQVRILEEALEREVSPSDEVLQRGLDVGRPRLSQLFNGMLRAGVLTVRRQGRSRLYRISEQARDHLYRLGKEE